MQPVIVKQDRDTKQVLRVLHPTDHLNVGFTLELLKRDDPRQLYTYTVHYVEAA